MFSRVGENLYRLESSGDYYGFLKRGRKQIRRSLKTNDRALARRRLSELREEVAALQSQSASDLTFEIVAQCWLASVQHSFKESTVTRRRRCIARNPWPGCSAR